MTLNGAIAICVFREFQLHFQGQTFPCYAFVINKLSREQMSRFASTRMVTAVKLLLLLLLSAGVKLVCIYSRVGIFQNFKLTSLTNYPFHVMLQNYK